MFDNVPSQKLGAGQDGLTNIWVPVVIFANTPYNDITPTDEKSSLTVEKVGNYVNSAWDQLEEVAYYEGAENPVTYRRKFNKNFACDFQLYYFPFDTQVSKKRNNKNDFVFVFVWFFF